MSLPIWNEKEYQLRTVKCLKVSRYFASVVASLFFVSLNFVCVS